MGKRRAPDEPTEQQREAEIGLAQSSTTGAACRQIALAAPKADAPSFGDECAFHCWRPSLPLVHSADCKSCQIAQW